MNRSNHAAALWLALILLAAVLLALGMAGRLNALARNAAETRQRFEESQAAMYAINDEKVPIQQETKRLQEAARDAQLQLEEAEAKIVVLEGQLAELGPQLETGRASLAAAQARTEAARGRAEALEAQLTILRTNPEDPQARAALEALMNPQEEAADEPEQTP